VYDVDWLGRVTAEALYTSEPTWANVTGNYDPYAWVEGSSTGNSGRTEVTRMSYDVLGRVYKREIAVVDTWTSSGIGTIVNKRLYNNYYDRRDLLVCAGDQKASHMEYVYDGAGRRIQERTIKDVQATKYNSGAFNYCEPDAADPTGGDEGVVRMAYTTFDAAGNATGVHEYEITHTDTNGINLSDTASFIRRTQYSWYDAADRLVASADYGAGDGTSGSTIWEYTSAPTRPSSALEWGSSAVSNGYIHLTTYGYDAAGRQDTVTIGVRFMGSSSTETMVTKNFFDDLGRTRFSVENDLSSNPLSGSPTSGADYDRTTGWTYDGLNNVAILTAWSSGSSSQQTKYYYTDSYNANLVTHTVYPGSSAVPGQTNLVQRDYDLDGLVNKMTDERTVEHTYTYNSRRQVSLDAVTGTIPSNVDSSVKSIAYGYNSLGQRNAATSYANNNGTGTVLNQIVFTFEVNGGIQTEFQSHDGAINWSTCPQIWHQRDGSASSTLLVNGLRLARLHYPNGADLDFEYGGTAFTNPDNLQDRLSQISKVKFTPASGTAQDITYLYNGVSRVVETDSTGPDIRRRMFGVDGAGTNDYNGWDQFGRPLSYVWSRYGAINGTIDRVNYSYDYAGNRLSRDIPSSLYATDDRDQVYQYDGLQRLSAMDQGTLASGAISGTPEQQEWWELDTLGNWATFDTFEDGVPTLEQTRTHNTSNMLTGFGATTGSVWATPDLDVNGNMTGIPQPSALTSSYALIYDAWNRLVAVKDGANFVQENEYDGVNRRIVKKKYASGSLDETRHYYFNSSWQVIEERVGTAADTARVDVQYVWHPEYVDAPAMRYWDSNSSGGPETAQFYTHDANYNVTAVTNSGNGVLERYAYTPYGKPTILNGLAAVDLDGSVSEFSVDSNQAISDINNTVLYTGREYDWETGLQINRNRYYASHLGRWLTRDPLGYVSQGCGDNTIECDLYEYVDGNPAIRLDPQGEFHFSVFKRFCKRFNIPPAPAPGQPTPLDEPCGATLNPCCQQDGDQFNRPNPLLPPDIADEIPIPGQGIANGAAGNFGCVACNQGKGPERGLSHCESCCEATAGSSTQAQVACKLKCRAAKF
jgi:RHS repeat-associated protein